jgi:hypothetical protein
MAVLICSTCLAAPREPGTAKCADCGPGRLFDPHAAIRQPSPEQPTGTPQLEIP